MSHHHHMGLRDMRDALLAVGLAVGFFLFLMWFFGGCAPLPPTPAPLHGGDYPAASEIVIAYPDNSPEALSSPCGQACTNLARLGCPEAGKTDAGTSCYRACVRMVQLEEIPVACWAKVTTRDALSICGPQIRCVP